MECSGVRPVELGLQRECELWASDRAGSYKVGYTPPAGCRWWFVEGLEAVSTGMQNGLVDGFGPAGTAVECSRRLACPGSLLAFPPRVRLHCCGVS